MAFSGIPGEDAPMYEEQEMWREDDTYAPQPPTPPLEFEAPEAEVPTDVPEVSEVVVLATAPGAAVGPEPNGVEDAPEMIGLPEMAVAAVLLPAMNKRKSLAGAAESAATFATLFKKVRMGADICMTKVVPIKRTETYVGIVDYVAGIRFEVDKRDPYLPDAVARLLVASLCFYNRRFKDVFLREYVELLHTLVGNEMLRSHNGKVHFKTGLGNWEAYHNIVPEIVFSKLRERLLVLEGSFLMIPTETKRTKEDVLSAMLELFEVELEAAPLEVVDSAKVAVDKAQHFKMVIDRLTQKAIDTMPKGKKAGGRGQDDGGKGGAGKGGGKGAGVEGAPEPEAEDEKDQPWTRLVAAAVSRVGWSIQHMLLGTNLIKHYSEWCNTPSPCVPGVAYLDTIILYDTKQGGSKLNVEHVKDDSRELNVYLGCNHKLLYSLNDPVLASAQARVEEIYQNTYWANAAAYKCSLAALALAKRGFNVDYMFLLLGSGGVGLSLTSAHLHAMLGSRLHRFGDPNVFFSDEELRKQIEQMQGAIVFTFQERPEGTTKAFREDLCKKVGSGDYIHGRMPYGVTTREIDLPGWDRLELNSILKFLFVTEKSFNTIFRRSWLCKFKGQFMDRSYLESTIGLEQAALAGLFPRDLTAKRFLVSGDAIAAGLRIQHGFECEHSYDDCVELLDDYVLRGGDGGLTYKYMRHACSLKPILETAPAGESPDSGASSSTVNANFIAMGEVGEEDDLGEWNKNARVADDKIVRNLLDQRQDYLTRTRLNYCHLTLVDRGKLSMDDFFTSLPLRGCWMSLEDKKGKGGERKVPIIATKNKYDALVMPIENYMEVARLPEVFVAGTWGPNDRWTDQVMGTINTYITYFSKCAKAIVVKGNNPPLVLKKQYLQKRLRGLEQARTLLNKLGTVSRVAVAGNVREKEDSREVTITSSYHLSMEGVHGRLYVTDSGGQQLSTWLQVLYMPNTIDFDIVNCVWCLVHQMVEKLELVRPQVFSQEIHTIAVCANDRNESERQKLQIDSGTWKLLLIRALNGETITEKALANNEFIIAVCKVGIFLRWLACSTMPTVYKKIRESKVKDWPEATTFAYWWQGVECSILIAMLRYAQFKDVHSITLSYDGFRVDNGRLLSLSESQQDSPAAKEVFCRDLETEIERIAGYEVKVIEKEHKFHEANFKELLTSREYAVGNDVFARPGAKLSMVLSRLFPGGVRDEMKTHLVAVNAENSKAIDLRSRTVKEAAQLHKINLEPAYSLVLSDTGKYLVTSVDVTGPSCFAIDYATGGECTLFFKDWWATTTVENVRRVSESSLGKGVTSTFRVVDSPLSVANSAPAEALAGLLELRM